MDKKRKNTSSIAFDNLCYLLDTLKKNGLEQVSLTGGDPMCYPELNKLLVKINSMNLKRTFFHTNGVGLSEDIIKNELKKFSKIAVSIHTLNFIGWNKMTNGSSSQFEELVKNLELLSEEGYSDKVEIKIVPIKGFNDSRSEIKKVLDFCLENKFKFKFLVFEPIEENHKKLVVSMDDLKLTLKSIGAVPSSNDADFRGQKSYLPINRYKYGCADGVVIEIGCGKKEVCSSCAESNEIFITPNLEIKPCHANPYLIALKDHVLNKDEKSIVNSVLHSRCFLKTKPGQDSEYWSQVK
jgi:molybdenum cofactor biosynthesis enzyme MoaA